MRAGKVGVARKAAEYDVLSDLDHGSIIETTNHHPLDKLEKTRLLHVAINFLKNTILSYTYCLMHPAGDIPAIDSYIPYTNV
jgi:hypothetical protein